MQVAINKVVEELMDEVAEGAGFLGDIHQAFDGRISTLIAQTIDKAERGGAASVGDYRDYWLDQDTQEQLAYLLFLNSAQRLSAVMVRDKLEIDPVRDGVVQAIWRHL